MLIAPLGSAEPSIMPPAPRSTSTRSKTAVSIGSQPTGA